MENKAFHDKFQLLSHDYEQVKQYIGVRLYPLEYIPLESQEKMLFRPFAGEVVAALIFDFPHTVGNVLKEDAEKWGKTEDELFAAGLANIRAKYNLQAEETDFSGDGDGGLTIYVAEDEHFFVSNILFELDGHKDLVGKRGAIVGIPTRSLALIYPINDKKIFDMLNVFFQVIPDAYASGPGSLTKEIYWYHDGQFEPLHYEIGEELSFYPSDGFVQLLNELFPEES
jgi:hypothetical protein